MPACLRKNQKQETYWNIQETDLFACASFEQIFSQSVRNLQNKLVHMRNRFLRISCSCVTWVMWQLDLTVDYCISTYQSLCLRSSDLCTPAWLWLTVISWSCSHRDRPTDSLRTTLIRRPAPEMKGIPRAAFTMTTRTGRQHLYYSANTLTNC